MTAQTAETKLRTHQTTRSLHLQYDHEDMSNIPIQYRLFSY